MKIDRYDLFMDVDFKKGTYTGKVTIKSGGDISELDAVDLNIRSVEVDGKSSRFTYDGKKVRLETTTGRNITVYFEGKVTDLLMGFYRANYKDGYVFSTQFESIGARRMFPCVDKPGVKAVFSLTVRVDDGLDVISNMPVRSVVKDGDKRVFSFYDTPRMSTYLLYLGIGKFEYLKDKMGDLEITVATPPGMAKMGSFALEVSKKVIHFYEEYFGIKYQLPKLHLIAVPEFAVGAMENWGAITFRETALLVKEDSAESSRRRVAEVVAHELAHQWFGDLVTMKWWDDLWLNESFATFMAYKAMDSIFPEWEVWTDFLLSETSRAFTRDSLTTTHPIHVEVESDEKVEEIFDDISYGKGASVLRMIESYIGKEAFRKGVSSYLIENSFENAEARQLWESLERASGKPVVKVMSEWITKSGHPVVFIQGNHVSQKRFLYLREEEGTWPIPFSYTDGERDYSSLLDTPQAAVEGGGIRKANLDQTGFYRVNYRNWEEALKYSRRPEDRWGVVSDLFAQVLRGNETLQRYISFVKYFLDETAILPVWEVSNHLHTLYLIAPEKVRKEHVDFHRKHYSRLQAMNDPNSKMLKGVIASRLAVTDEGFAKQQAEMIDNYQSVEPDMKTAVLVSYAQVGNRPFEDLISLYKKSFTDEEKGRSMTALMLTRKREDLALGLGFLLNGEVKRQDVIRFFQVASGNVHGRDLAWAWFKANIEPVKRLYHATGVLGRVLSYSLPYLGLGREEEVKKFFSDNPIPSAETGIKTGLEMLDVVSKIKGL